MFLDEPNESHSNSDNSHTIEYIIYAHTYVCTYTHTRIPFMHEVSGCLPSLVTQHNMSRLYLHTYVYTFPAKHREGPIGALVNTQYTRSR